MQSSTILELIGIQKSFGSVRANTNVNLQVKKGTIHSIVGENGAGKSTAMKIVYGLYAADQGLLKLDGKVCEWRSPRDAIASGIGMVHQHFMLAGPHTVLENILLGIEGNPFRFGSLEAPRKKLTEIMNRYGLEVSLDAAIETLPVGLQQRVEILKLLFRDSDILILDEPTAVLAPQEIHRLFECLRALCDEGKTVLVITHKLKEVLKYTDEVTIFRAGAVVGHRPTATCDIDQLAELMVGKKFERVSTPQSQAINLEPPILSCQNFSFESPSANRKISALNFSLHPGEIVGIAGVEGNGQSELLHALLLPEEGRRTGSIQLFGKELKQIKASDLRQNIGVFAEDRLHEALLLESDLNHNLILGYQRRPELQKNGLLRNSAIGERSKKLLEEYDVRPRVREALAQELSGGNQQKLVVARELSWSPKLLIAAQPTRGVDVLAIEFIHERILSLRQKGSGVLLVSSELDELMKLSDRILVMFDGKMVAEFSREQFEERKIGLAMGGGKQ